MQDEINSAISLVKKEMMSVGTAFSSEELGTVVEGSASYFIVLYSAMV